MARQPAAKKPAASTAKKTTTAKKPAASSAKKTTTAKKPAASTAKKTTTAKKPAASTAKKTATAKKPAASTAKKTTTAKKPVAKKSSTRFPKRELNTWLKANTSWDHTAWEGLIADLEKAGFTKWTSTQEGKDEIGLYLETNKK